MSKIICEVCGTAYPEMSTQCPICGCVRPAGAQGVRPAANEASEAGGYHHVKGGRFSKANVRKRNSGKQVSSQGKSRGAAKNGNNNSNNTGLVITIVVLLLAIIAVILYIVLKFFVPSSPDSVKDTTTTADTTESIETTDGTVACEEIILGVSEVVLEAEGDTVALNTILYPTDTTDTLTYSSSDLLVATVSKDGVITAVGPGEATITATCGSAIALCDVSCVFVEETTEASIDNSDFRLNRSSITFEAKGDSWDIYSGDVPDEEIIWYSDNNAVATITNGNVTAVGNGSTTVYADYNGSVVSCQIICSFSDNADQGHDGNGGISEEGDNSVSSGDSGEYHLDNLYSQYDTEVTVGTGESFPLQLLDSNGKKVDATWSVQNSNVCTVSDGKVTAVGSGDTYIIATYNGVEYKCLVHVM